MIILYEDFDLGIRFTITLTKIECDILKDSLSVREGIVKWFSDGVSQNKITQCCSRMLEREKSNPEFIQSIAALPAEDFTATLGDPTLAAPYILACASYKDRVARDAEA